MAIVHSYVRFSTEDQLQGDSLRRQVEGAKAFIRKHRHQQSNLTFHDLGRSAYRGRKQKALDLFLEAIDKGLVKSGDIFLVESVDRLSRKGIRETQTLVNHIHSKGIDIAILTPIEKVYRANDDNDIGGQIELAAFAYQAKIYSQLLSGRIKDWWTVARGKARDKGQTIPTHRPAWVKKDFSLDETKAQTIRFIFDRTVEGIGQGVLCRELNQDHKPFGKARWNKTYIRSILVSRAVLGEYQPHVVGDDGKRVPEGDVIKGYYPVVIDEPTWERAQLTASNRLIERGPSKEYVHLFTGLVWHGIDDCPCHVYTYQQTRKRGVRRGEKVIFRRLKSYKAISNDKGASKPTVDLVVFEREVLRYLKEVDLSIFEGKRQDNELERLRDELAKKESRLAELKEAVEGDGELASLLPNIKNLGLQIKELKAKIRNLAAKEAVSMRDSVQGARKLIDLATTPENRQRLREALKRIIERIVIWPVKFGGRRRDPVNCLCHVHFKDGNRKTIYMFDGKSIAYNLDELETENFNADAWREFYRYTYSTFPPKPRDEKSYQEIKTLIDRVEAAIRKKA